MTQAEPLEAEAGAQPPPLSLPMIWVSLHEPPATASGLEQREQIEESARALLGNLSGTEACRWAMVGDATGWTAQRAIALSWCQNAVLKGVLTAWRNALEGCNPQEAHLYHARLINPALLPRPQLSALIEAGEDYKGLWLLLAAHKQLGNPIEQDLPPEKLALMQDGLKKLL